MDGGKPNQLQPGSGLADDSCRLQALKQANSQPFLAGSLAATVIAEHPPNSNRLRSASPRPASAARGIAGMTCSACHTRQITAGADLSSTAAGHRSISEFSGRSRRRGGSNGRPARLQCLRFRGSGLRYAGSDDVTALRQDFARIFASTPDEAGAPTPAWGREARRRRHDLQPPHGLDLGPPPSLIIADNIKMADAPVLSIPLERDDRDQTQWPGLPTMATCWRFQKSRQVFSVFVFQPKHDEFGLFVNFLSNNSANFDGLGKLEDLIKQINRRNGHG